MALFKLALKNLTRHKRRTAITSLALVFGLVIIIVLDSTISGMLRQSDVNLKDSETGDGKILAYKYFEYIDYLPLNFRIKNPDEIISKIEKLGVKSCTRVNTHGEMIYTEDYFPKEGSSPILFTAVDIEKDSDVFNVFNKKSLINGRFFNKGADEVVIGSWLAEDIGAEIGSFITLSLVTASDGDDPGYGQTIDVEIVGIMKVESPIINRQVVYYPLDMADYYLDLNGSVTEIALKIPKGTDISLLKKEIEKALPGNLGFYHWRVLAADYLKSLQLEGNVKNIMIILIVFIAFVGIFNTMLMSLNERENEIGMMRALGMNDFEIRKLFIFEAIGIGLLGSICGLFLGILVNIPIVEIGIDFSNSFRDIGNGYRISSYIKGVWNISNISMFFLFGIFLPGVLTIGPTKKAIKKSIPDCINRR